ncbi:phosphate ABC transporter substrate-binding/OmpA family protein, partial [Phyllobacterium sp.]|uniref:phosphate ABC transporter substrate-binding/OmpA family protein n=1 Tax=Phyllobacterium sp. TaxID=1871046 RepID=UPI0031FD1E29|nr:OmpA family protein [Phyllobacterium sp.]
ERRTVTEAKARESIGYTGEGSTVSGTAGSSSASAVPATVLASAPTIDNSDPTIHLSLDEWIGWKPIIDANQGLTTQPGSIFDRLGLKVNLHIINDADSSSNALIKGDLNAAGYTINRTAFLSGKFKAAGLDVVIPVFTNYSDGGDGIIATTQYNTIESLVDAKVGVPKFSEAQTLVVWFVNKSDLPDAQKRKIIDNLVLLDDAEQTGQAFFSGSLDAAATWQPYLSNAENSTNSHILFSTASSNKLIMDGILFRSDFAEAHPDVISAFIDGIFQASGLYETEFGYLRSVMPMYAVATDEEILTNCADAGLMGYSENLAALEDDCPGIYSDMCSIWESLGESTNRELGATLFDASYVRALSTNYSSLPEQKTFTITAEQKEAAVDAAALLTKTATINFVPDTAKFLDAGEADAALAGFVEMAKTLDGTIIQIEGNINAKNNTEAGMKLSEERAKTVRNYFVASGVDPNRIIVIGNGNTKMLTEPDSADAELNRRTDVFFKTLEAYTRGEGQPSPFQ